jgi:hypothetical protein
MLNSQSVYIAKNEMNSDTCNSEIYDVRKFPYKEKGPINGSRMMQCTVCTCR